MLGASTNCVVLPEAIRWEPSRGAVLDLVLGRRLLFLASDRPNGPRDVWRASVRVTPDGMLLGVADTHNLTSTPLGDDHALVLEGGRAAFATSAFGQEQSVTLLDLNDDDATPAWGAGASPRDVAGSGESEPWLDGVTRWLTNARETGSGRGIERMDISLDQPALAVGLALHDGKVTIDLLDPGGVRRHAQADFVQTELATAASGMHAEVSRQLPKRFILWAVDTVRSVSWIGPAPIAWLEEHVFAVKDDIRRLAYKARGGESTETLADVAAVTSAGVRPAPSTASVLDTSGAGEEGEFPPASLPSIWKTREPGEGEWVVPKIPWLKKMEGAPAAFVRTFVRPDPDRPYARVILVAMDMRQLDLEMEAGTEDPKPLTGGHGPGRIPRDPAVFTRVAAAFNGAFKTEHGNYGMMVHKHVLLPPQPNAASVIVLADQRVGFGTWGNTHEISGIRGVDSSDILSFRQNLDALVDQGEVNPAGRALWGYTLPGQGMQTERTALCVTKSGHLLYGWGDDVSGTALGKAMKIGGCDYAMHLDMNPHHTGFIFAAVNDLKSKSYRSELLTPLMTVSPERFIEYAPKDFFYVLLHDPTPSPTSGVTWHAEGQQPPPSWAPALFSSRVPVDGSSVELLDIEPARASFRIRAGTAEPDSKTGASASHDLDEADSHRVLFSVSLGRATEKHPRGLATDGRLVYPMTSAREGVEGSSSFGVLVAPKSGGLTIRTSDEESGVGAHVDVAELPLVLAAAEITPSASRSGLERLRFALGTTAAGRVIVARAIAASDAPLGEALRRAGCSRAVALDRGLSDKPFLHRAGTDTPPRARYEDSALYALALPLLPRAFRFEPDPAASDATKAK
jgi:hypothetical protein